MPDYPAAIDFPAHSSNTLGPPCTPKGWVLHTPEEPADGYPGTPHWFARPNVGGSTHYFVSYLGFVFQCVPENVGPIANGVLGKPYPAWANSGQSLNRQTLSVEIEGYAATIRNTISPAQKTALVNLLAYGCEKYGIPKDRAHIIGHYEVANNRTDPGTLDINEVVGLVATPPAVEEDDLANVPQKDWDDLKRKVDQLYNRLEGWKMEPKHITGVNDLFAPEDDKFLGTDVLEEVTRKVRQLHRRLVVEK